MSKNKFRDLMREIKDDESCDDPESAHSHADELLCQALEELGYGAGVKIFKEMDKWYA